MPTPFLLNGILASQISGHLYAGPAGAFDALGSVTANGTSGLITFSAIPQTYTHLQLRIFARGTVSAAQMQIYYQFNNDSSSSYANHGLRGDGSSAYAFSGSGTSASGQARLAAASASSGMFGAAITDILDYSNAYKNKTIRTLSGTDQNGSGQVYFTSGLWINQAPVTSLTIGINDGGNFDTYTNFSLYGAR